MGTSTRNDHFQYVSHYQRLNPLNNSEIAAPVAADHQVALQHSLGAVAGSMHLEDWEKAEALQMVKYHIISNIIYQIIIIYQCQIYIQISCTIHIPHA